MSISLKNDKRLFLKQSEDVFKCLQLDIPFI